METQELFSSEKQEVNPVTCLGMTFPSDIERREYFRGELRKKLPELKLIDGFPIGEDDDIIALSDPPYYTACPNPWINDFIAEWEKEKESIPGYNTDFLITEPYASDISEGKNNPIYNAHTYHTKVPHPAIMRYLLHYTQPGDIVFDGFAGTGMTGVAAQVCGHPDAALKEKIEKEWDESVKGKPKWGNRKAILGELSPIASFIAYNYNALKNVMNEYINGVKLLEDLNTELGWVYSTNIEDGRYGLLSYTIWSEVFNCSNCNEELLYWDVALNSDTGEILDEFVCSSCKARLAKTDLLPNWTTKYDDVLKQAIKQRNYCPVMKNYYFKKNRYFEKINAADNDLLKKIEHTEYKYWFPKAPIPYGVKTKDAIKNGRTHVHHFYTKRNLIVIAGIWEKSKDNSLLRLALSSVIVKTASLLNNMSFKNGNVNLAGALPNAIYFPSNIAERNVLSMVKDRMDDYLQVFSIVNSLPKTSIVGIQSATAGLMIAPNTIDYIFIDPPFGSNLMYSELNFVHESWLRLTTNQKSEAIVNSIQLKGIPEYQRLMEEAFRVFFNYLKPGKWMTVEFSNTSAAIWNCIQTSLQRSGFIIANVSALDKQQGTFNSKTSSTAVKQDLVISCYKPSAKFEKEFQVQSSNTGVWDFVKEHLEHLPIHIQVEGNTTAIIERSPKILYDRLITFYLMRNLPIPIDASDFQAELRQRFSERDGMFFTAEQATEYDAKKAKAPRFVTLSLFVTTENEGIEWLREELKKPQSYQELHPNWMKAITAVRKGDILPELREILEENFIQANNGKWRVPDMNEIKDREIFHTKVLMKEFNKYLEALESGKLKKLKEVRTEALRTGFKICWEKKDFDTILTIANKIPQNILLEDDQLLMYYDIAKDKV